MAKDYKNTPKSTRKDSKPAPGWVWMLGGLAIGLFVALLVYLKDYSPAAGEDLKPAPVVDKGRAAETTPAADDKEKSAQRPRFDFYNLLPEMEVLIPDEDLASERERDTSSEQVTYFLQVGSFRHFEEADKLRAQLAFLNLESHIQRVTVDAGQAQTTWHRVRVGPFDSAREMDKIRSRLRAESFDPIVLKVKS